MKSLLVLTLIFSLICPVNSLASCTKPVQELQEGQKAPCRGYLFSPTKEQYVRIQVEDNALLKKEIELKDLKVTILYEDMGKSNEIVNKEREKTELWRLRAEDSTKKLIESEDGRGSRDFLMVILGVALTVGAGFAIGQAAK